MTVFDKTAFERMTAHVRNAYPKEGCGILLGREGGRWIRNVAVISNLSEPDQAGKHFLMDPLAVYRAEREASENGMDIVGFYHSHPDREAVPSKEDEAYLIPGMVYIILSVINNRIERISGYWKAEADGQVLKVPVETEEARL